MQHVLFNSEVQPFVVGNNASNASPDKLTNASLWGDRYETIQLKKPFIITQQARKCQRTAREGDPNRPTSPNYDGAKRPNYQRTP